MRRHAPHVSSDPLDTDALLAQLPSDVSRRIEGLEVFATLESTNTYLLAAPAPSRAAVRLCIADHQQHGRGRRGRRWDVPAGAGLCLSVALHMGGARSGPLPLAAGVAARRAIAAATGVSIALKWPNDLAWSERKLGGILVERAPLSTGGHVVIGIGINVAVPPPVLRTLCDWPAGAVDLAEATGGAAPSRTVLAARLITELVELAGRFDADGLAPYREELRAADMLFGRRVRVVGERGTLSGTACGVDEEGALLVGLPDGSPRRVLSGDVSVRIEHAADSDCVFGGVADAAGRAASGGGKSGAVP